MSLDGCNKLAPYGMSSLEQLSCGPRSGVGKEKQDRNTAPMQVGFWMLVFFPPSISHFRNIFLVTQGAANTYDTEPLYSDNLCNASAATWVQVYGESGPETFAFLYEMQIAFNQRLTHKLALI